MLRPRGGVVPISRMAPARSASGAGLYQPKSKRQNLSAIIFTHMYTILLLLLSCCFGMVLQSMFHTVGQAADAGGKLLSHQPPGPLRRGAGSINRENLPVEFHRLLDRALLQQEHCKEIGLVDAEDHAKLMVNNHTAHLPHFGILNAFQNHNHDNYPYQCEIPPDNECQERQFTVIFMAYNPDRLDQLVKQIKVMTSGQFAEYIAEVIVVWNGSREVEETAKGKEMVDLQKTRPFRISYPLKAGFPNDLMNRYHPRLEVKTKAIMYYDDDGPFYSFKATLGGFELWKRNANAQIGAMARKLDLNARQKSERQAILNGPGDRFFVSHCPGDSLRYNFNEFANFGANMVLPSGSFLHSNYLCWLWHPVFQEIRDYVKQHPVNPDDGTVSIIVSQLSGRAPRVYSRRINEATGRRLMQEDMIMNDNHHNETAMMFDTIQEEERHDVVPRGRRRRRLMDGIDWDSGGKEDKKHRWGKLRSDAANSLVRYFGSINSGSIGWCFGTPYQSGEYCKPEMAKIGYLPWMKEDGSPRDVCP
jgi:hypothetical protein